MLNILVIRGDCSQASQSSPLKLEPSRPSDTKRKERENKWSMIQEPDNV